jgi:3-oxoacyl-[acyl-carrier protein] reductase
VEAKCSKLLKNQVAIVTGAGSAEGIGLATARRLLACGARVAITSTTLRIAERARELDSSNSRVFCFAADRTDQAQAKTLVDAVIAWQGRIDILVNNAGMIQSGRPMQSGILENVSLVDWQLQLAISLQTLFLMSKAVLPVMKNLQHGIIVNVSSVTAPLVSSPGSAAYGAAKGGMHGMMLAAALEYAACGITFNAVAPVWIQTASSASHSVVPSRHAGRSRRGDLLSGFA